MVLRVGFCSLASVVIRMLLVSVSRVGVMRGLLVVAGLVMLCGFLVMTCRMLVMFCCLQVMLCCLFRHVTFLLCLDCGSLVEISTGISVWVPSRNFRFLPIFF